MNNILLTGIPKIGKTTIIRKIVDMMQGKCAGFYTEEINEKNRRVGFNLITLDGKQCILAHKNIKGRYRVGKYRVNIECIEKIGVVSIRKGIEEKGIIIIDEIGKMELYSKEFKNIVLEALDSALKIIGTVLFHSHPFCDKIKDREDVEIIEVTKDNRNFLPSKILKKNNLNKPVTI